MTGPKLETALQGLQDAINDLDRTILDAAGRFSTPRASEASSEMSADSGLSADMLRAELEALRQMIARASALIDGEQEDSAMASDEVSH